MSRKVRLVYPHQLHRAQLQVDPGTRLVVVEDDLLYRQLPFHAHKLVLHHASVRRFVDRARDEGYDVDLVESSPDRSSGQALVQLRAPDDQRGRVVGVYSMIGSGMRTGNGLTIGGLGALLGVSGAVAVGGGALMAGALLIGALIALQNRRGAAA